MQWVVLLLFGFKANGVAPLYFRIFAHFLILFHPPLADLVLAAPLENPRPLHSAIATPSAHLALRARIQLRLFVSINLSALHVITPTLLALIYKI